MKRRIIIVGLALVLSLLLGISVTAQTNTSQIIALSEQGETVILSAQNSLAFWERPTLKAGESYAATGTLTLVNNTKIKRTIALDTVKLPFDNETSLRYLNHLILRVTEGETVLFEGPYSTINDTNGLLLHRELEAGQSSVLSISLCADYACPEKGLTEDEWLDWQFYSFSQTAEPIVERFKDPALLEIAIAAGAAGLLLAGVLLFDKFRKR